MELINCTPHPICVRLHEEEKIFQPSGVIPRVATVEADAPAWSRCFAPAEETKGGMDMTLKEQVHAMAVAAMANGIPVDDTPGGAVHKWVAANVKRNPEHDFFIVFLLCCEMADLDAQTRGFASQALEICSKIDFTKK